MAELLRLLKNTETRFMKAGRLRTLGSTSEEMTLAPREIGPNEVSRVANLGHLTPVSEEPMVEDDKGNLQFFLIPPISDSDVSVANRGKNHFSKVLSNN
jgi:hypothetical protein